MRKKVLYKNNNLNLNDNKLKLFTTAVDPRYRLSAFHSYFKTNVKEQLNVKNHIDFEADQSVDSLKLPPEKAKPQPSLNLNPYKFSTNYSLFKT